MGFHSKNIVFFEGFFGTKSWVFFKVFWGQKFLDLRNLDFSEFAVKQKPEELSS